MLAGCGGGDGGPTSSTSDGGPTSFASDDGVVSVEVPPGAAPDGFSGTVTKSDPSALSVDISDVESVFLVYELGPDGTEFDEPVMVTFRISPVLGGFDPDLGLPLSLVVMEDDAGGFEPLGSMTSFLDGDVLVVEGTTTHFSKTIIEIGNFYLVLGLDPEGETKKVGSQFEAEVKLQGGELEDPGLPDDRDLRLGRVDYSFGGTISEVSIQAAVATVLCAEEGEGLVEARVFGSDKDAILDFLWLANVLTGGSAEYLGKLSHDVECVKDLPEQDPSEDPTDEDPTEAEPEDSETESGLSLLDFLPDNSRVQLGFLTHEYSPPIPPYTFDFDFEFDAEPCEIKMTQQPSDQTTEGPCDRVTGGFFTTGGGSFEAYVGVICPLPDGSYFIAGYTFGGADSMAETFQSLMDSIPGLDVSFSPPQSISVDPALAPNCDEFASNPSELGEWMRTNLGPSGPIPGAQWDLVFSGGFQP